MCAAPAWVLVVFLKINPDERGRGEAVQSVFLLFETMLSARTVIAAAAAAVACLAAEATAVEMPVVGAIRWDVGDNNLRSLQPQQAMQDSDGGGVVVKYFGGTAAVP